MGNPKISKKVKRAIAKGKGGTMTVTKAGKKSLACSTKPKAAVVALLAASREEVEDYIYTSKDGIRISSKVQKELENTFLNM